MSDKLVTGLVLGAAIGVIAGLLWAPRLGKESRRVVVVQAGELRQKANEYLNNLRRMMREEDGEEAIEGLTEGQAGTPG
jgi:gas vesicle protein